MSSRFQLGVLGLVAIACVAAFAWWRAEATATADRGPMVVVGVLTDEEHRVTPEMERAGAAMADQAAPPFRAVAQDGRVVDSADLVGERPVVLVFIKDGCPCSTSAEPYYARLHAAYGGEAAFLGIIDGGPEVAARWVADHGTPYPVLADPGLEVVRAYGVRSSAYVALLDRGGRIVSLWPGYSEGILRDISTRLATSTGQPEQDVAAAEAPDLPYSGCPFSIDSGDAPTE